MSFASSHGTRKRGERERERKEGGIFVERGRRIGRPRREARQIFLRRLRPEVERKGGGGGGGGGARVAQQRARFFGC